jgi:hypothetical protein
LRWKFVAFEPLYDSAIQSKTAQPVGSGVLVDEKRLITTLAITLPYWRSSASRSDSSIHVENVVYEPTAAVPASSAWSWLRASPASKPRTAAPEMLTMSVPNGKSRPIAVDAAPSTRNRRTEPAPPITATAHQSRTVMFGP